MKKAYTLILLFTSLLASGQTTISGTVKSKKGEALAFANVSIEGSYDGASTDENGTFSFTTDLKGSHKLQASLLGYLKLQTEININAAALNIDLKLTESINALNAVVVSAGMFEASDEKKMVMLRPIDIVTTAGGGADITGVMQLLPGANRVGETEGLFVRGGSANETKTIIDGMIVQNPFFSSTPDVPQRGRFNPFMFKGTAFSTGGYSAQYGQALSSVLLLNTMDKQSDNTNLSLSANLAGIGGSFTHKGWLTGSLNYTNIAPLLGLMKTNIGFEKVPQGLGGSLNVNEKFKNGGDLKISAVMTNNQSALRLPNYDKENTTFLFDNNNDNIFTNASYRQAFKDGKWLLNTGLSFSDNKDELRVDQFKSDRGDRRTQARAVVSRLFGNNNTSSFLVGTEYHNINYSTSVFDNTYKLTDNYSAAFAETEVYLSPKLATRMGVRVENSTVIDKANLAPRLSLAYKVGKYAQFSMAAGKFYQNPEKEYLYTNRTLDFELADHLILNYQIIKQNRTFRIETFYKDYKNLVLENTNSFDANPYRFPTGQTNNNGAGFAKGFDIFFRDQKTIKSGDFWITYSFLDTERKYKNFPQTVTPYFATRHNLSFVYKQFLTKISTNIGFTFTHTSGRPIYFSNVDFSKPEYTKAFQNLSFMGSHVKQFKNQFVVFYAMVDNILGRKNIFGYRYSQDGTQRFEVKPPMYRTVFFGMIWTFGKLNGRSREAELDF